MVLPVKTKVNEKILISIEKYQWVSFMSKYELSNVEIITSNISVAVDNKQIRKNMKCIRIGTESSSSYIKVTKQFNLRVLPPLINMRQLSYNFIILISINILDAI